MQFTKYMQYSISCNDSITQQPFILNLIYMSYFNTGQITKPKCKCAFYLFSIFFIGFVSC